MPHVSVHGFEAHFRDEGHGKPLVLGHSSTASSGQWRALVKRMSGQYRLMAPDHVGYGLTPTYPGVIPLAKLEVAIIEALLRLAAEPVHLVGHSYGGMVLARAAIRIPDRVRSLTLIEPTLFYLLAAFGLEGEHAEIAAVADRVARCIEAGDADAAGRGFIEYWVGPGGYDAMDPKLREAVRAGMPKVSIEFPTGFVPNGAEPDALKALRMPIQLIGGARTTTAARGIMKVLRRLFPNAVYREIAGGGHMCPVTHADAVNELIVEFVDRKTGRGRSDRTRLLANDGE
jgi:pimeloyl-ACP methyl ester carboxylesterase